MRQGQILELVTREHVASQDELRRRLRQQGVRVTQATLSRDIAELGLAKTPDGWRQIAAPAPAAIVPQRAAAPAPGGVAALTPLARALQEFLLDVRPAQNLLVLKTPPGGAQPIAAALDGQKWKEVLGTIAGDDTVLIIAASARTRLAVQHRVEELLK